MGENTTLGETLRHRVAPDRLAQSTEPCIILYMDAANNTVTKMEAKRKLAYIPEPTEYCVFPDKKNEFVRTFLSQDLALAHIKKLGGKLLILDQYGRRMKQTTR